MREQYETLSKSKITGAILAGGLGTRMGGCDKGLVKYCGRPLIESVMETITPQVEQTLIVANRNIASYSAYGVSVHEDAVSGFPGPLAGMLTAAKHTETDLILTVPCDVPDLPGDLVSRLLDALVTSGTDVCAADDGERVHPVICLWRRSVMATLESAIEQRHLKVYAWLQQQSYSVADFSDCPACFRNLNRPLDLEANARKAGF